MIRSTVSTLALCLALALSGCSRSINSNSPSSSSSGALTNSVAEQTLNQWMPGCNATVTGIQEVPQNNTATVNVMFSDFHFLRTEEVYDDQQKGFRQGQVPKTYSGPGIANFTHYNDGRWVLTKVITSQGAASTHWDDLSVEAR